MSERATNCFTFSALEKISLANISMNRGASSITAKIFILIGVISYNLQRGEFLLAVKRRETLTGQFMRGLTRNRTSNLSRGAYLRNQQQFSK